MVAPRVYQETRLDLTPAFPGSSIEVELPSNANFFSRQSPKRRRLDSSRVTYDESIFSRQCLAVESAIYFLPPRKRAKKRRNPRAILWRVLDEHKVLELQAVDLFQDRAAEPEPLLTLRVRFPNALRPSCVSFTEHANDDESDTTLIFALTQSGELFTLTLKKELFTKRDLAEGNFDWIKSWKPNAFGYRTPFRLHAESDKTVWAALTDGTLVKLDSLDSSSWRESFFTQGGWKSSMRSLIPWASTQSVRFGNLDLHPNTILSLGLSPDKRHVWAVCLDHALRAWNVETGKLVFTQDLAGDTSRDFEKPSDRTIPPTRTLLLQIISPTPGDDYMLVTFSPLTQEFKFWLVRDLESESAMAWEVAQPDCSFIVPIENLENSSLWSLESFYVDPSGNPSANWTIWILARSGSRCNTYQASFQLHDPAPVVMQSWQDNWTAVHGCLSSADVLKQSPRDPNELDPLGQGDGSAVVDKWLEFLFYPGRFTEPTLETALHVYCKNPDAASRNSRLKTAAQEPSLKARISEAVGSLVHFEPADNDAIAYQRYQRSLSSQWQIFYGVVKDLHSRRGRELCLSYDTEEKLPWLILADGVSPLRNCSQIEILWHNRALFANPLDIRPGSILLESLSDIDTSQIGQLFFALDIFHSFLSKSFLENFTSVVRAAVLENDSPNALDSLLENYGLLGFESEVSDEDYDTFMTALNPLGGMESLNNDLFSRALELLDESQRGRSHKKQLNRYGARALIRGAQETLQLGSNVLLDLMSLVVFMTGELEQGDLINSFDPNEIFPALAEKFKEYDLLGWLTATSYSDSMANESEASSGHDAVKIDKFQSTTIFEYMFIGDWSTLHHPNASTGELLTYWCRAWILGLRLNENYDKIACHVFAALIKRDDTRLALRFLPFVPETLWAEYLIGRLSVSLCDFPKAAQHLKRASSGLSSGKFLNPANLDSAGLLDGVERTYLNDGLPRYYQHVVELFDRAKAHSYAGDFAQLALQAMEKESRLNASLRSDLLSRLFTASLYTLRFEVAFGALIQHNDLALRKSSLKLLVQAILKANQIQTLLRLPYPADLAVDADDQLAALAAKHKAQASSSFFGNLSSEDESPQYHKILYAFRLQRNDLRGAASCLWGRLELLCEEQKKGLRGEDIDEEVAQNYLALINTLSLMDHDQAWILTNPSTSGETAKKRRVVTLEHIRRAWQDELDRVADVAAGRFSFGIGAAEMEVEA